MDIKLEKKPWYIRYRYYLAGGVAFCAFLVYVIILSAGPRKLRIEQDNIQIAEVRQDKFMEYVDVEGLVQPILTIKVNAREAGSVLRIVGEEGSLLKQGDTILVLENPDLLRDIEDQQDEWEKQLVTYREKEIEMQQQSLTLRQQALETDYELAKLRRTYELEQEEYNMGIKSRAQLQVAEDEYRFKEKTARLQRESLRHDSVMSLIQRDLLQADRERERKKYLRSRRRLADLVVHAPIGGQLSFVGVTPGQQVQSGESIGEIKVLDQFKVHTSLSEYYIDRITTGLELPCTDRVGPARRRRGHSPRQFLPGYGRPMDLPPERRRDTCPPRSPHHRTPEPSAIRSDGRPAAGRPGHRDRLRLVRRGGGTGD